jgi:hypothetical protein
MFYRRRERGAIAMLAQDGTWHVHGVVYGRRRKGRGGKQAGATSTPVETPEATVSHREP